jgi:maltooligosyltrehalose trehalohydrolase
VHLILENEENQAALLGRDAAAAPAAYTAQWNDDLHHVLHVAATGESTAYYAEYHGDTEKLGRALAEGFAFQGQTMRYRDRARGEPSAGLPPTAFVGFVQNHDQVGNRAFGDRLTRIAPDEAVRAAAAVYLLCPQIPMLFMGEEWGSSRPFLFFCDFGAELADAVREGRRAEFARFPEFSDPATRERIPDPQAEETFLASKLDWDAAEEAQHAKWRDFYRRLLVIRRKEIAPGLRGIGGHSGSYEVLGPQAVRVAWRLGDGAVLTLVANLSAEIVDAPLLPATSDRVIWRQGAALPGRLAAWSVVYSLAEEA